MCFCLSSLTSTLALRGYHSSLNKYADVEQTWAQIQQGATTCTHSSRKNHLGEPCLDHVIFSNTQLTDWASWLRLKPQSGCSCYEVVLWVGSLEGNEETYLGRYFLKCWCKIGNYANDQLTVLQWREADILRILTEIIAGNKPLLPQVHRSISSTG